MSKQLKFFIVNLCLVILFVLLLLGSMNGTGNPFPINVFVISMVFALPIIYCQYQVLNFKKNWWYKTLIFYLSMVLFLFLLGITLSWNEPVGDNEAGTWLARLDAGLRMIVFGQLFGGFVAFLIILTINFGLRKRLF